MSVPFNPNGARGALIDGAVRRSAAESLLLLSDAIAAQRPDLIAGLQRWIAKLHSGPVRPAIFALYSDLVEAIYSDDEPAFQSAMTAIAELEVDASYGVRGITLADQDLGPGMTVRFLRHLDDDPATPLNAGPISSEELRLASNCLTSTWNLLDVAAPELSLEIRALVRDVIFVSSESGAGGLVFHGASTFYLWGGLFLNAQMHPDRVSMAEGLAHEAAHSLLFGYSFGAPLVENDDSERFSSPLREDQRPMDGIVHATYVLARMYYCIERLLASQVLNAAERDRLEVAKLRRRSDYLQGLEVVSTHARFTPLGRSLFAGAQTYMATVTTG